MSERVEAVRLTAQVSNYLAGMQQASQATDKTSTAAQKLAKQGQAFTTLGHTLLVFGGAVAAGVALAVKEFAEFDAQMSQVKTLSHATSNEMEGLTQAALTFGKGSASPPHRSRTQKSNSSRPASPSRTSWEEP